LTAETKEQDLKEFQQLAEALAKEASVQVAHCEANGMNDGPSHLNGGDPRMLCELQYSFFRDIAIASGVTPRNNEMLKAAWMKFLVAGLINYRNICNVANAVDQLQESSRIILP